jgi:sigma-E factor negative regulatory protein RseB
VRASYQGESRPAAKQGGSAVTSVAVLFLILAPAFVAITGAEVLQHGKAGAREGAAAGTLAVGQAGEHPDDQVGPRGDEAPAGPRTAMRGATRVGEATEAGLRLLHEAVSVGRTVPYEGVQIISWWSPRGTTTTAVVNVIHVPGKGTLLRNVGTIAQPVGSSFVPDQSGAHAGGVLGVTEETLDLLEANYYVGAAGTGSVCDRPTQIVEARREDGSLAARFWVDGATKMPLRRELFDLHARMVSENTFIDLEFSRPARTMAFARAQAGAASRPWGALTAADLNRLRARGWPLPAGLPGGLTLFEARQVATPSGPVFQLGYSDGLSGVSLFVQRGVLPGRPTGWNQITFDGRQFYTHRSLEQGLTWSSRGHVLTLIADAPASTINAVVKALPHDTQRGFWDRVRHGFGRLVSWIDPFG